MYNNEDLVSIISSLTKHEKIFFKRFCAGYKNNEDKSYLKLFKIIDDSGFCDDTIIKREHKNERFTNYISVTKKYLREMILKSLVLYHSGDTFDGKLKEAAMVIKILYDKALYSTCVKLINKTKQQAYEAEDFTGILELIKLQRNLIHEGAYKGNGFAYLKKSFIEEVDTLNRIKNIGEYRFLSYSMRDILIKKAGRRSPALTETINEIKNNPLLNSETMALSNTALTSYYHIKSFISQFENNYAEAYKNHLKLLGIIISNKNLLRENPANYIITLNNIINDCINLNDYSKAEYYVNEMNTLETKFNIKLRENLKILVTIGSLLNEFWLYIMKGEFEKAGCKIHFLEEGIRKYKTSINKFDSLLCSVIVISIYFAIGNYKKSLEWANMAINEHDISIDEKKYMHARMLHLLIHYELENYNFLENSIKYVKRYLKGNKITNNLYKIILEFISYACEQRTRIQKKELYSLILNKLDKLQEVEKNLLMYNYIYAVIESKISGKSFEEVYRKGSN